MPPLLVTFTTWSLPPAIPADVRAKVWRHARYLSARDAVGDHRRVRHRWNNCLVLTLPVRRACDKSIEWSKWDTNTGIEYVMSVLVDGQFLTGICVDEKYTGRYWRYSRWHLIDPVGWSGPGVPAVAGRMNVLRGRTGGRSHECPTRKVYEGGSAQGGRRLASEFWNDGPSSGLLSCGTGS